jgi:hypothetical protein
MIVMREIMNASKRRFNYKVKAGQPIRHKLFPGRYATRKIRKSRVDSRPARSTSKWSSVQSAIRYQVAALIRRRLTLKEKKCVSHFSAI